MIKEDIIKLEQIISTITTFNDIANQKYQETAVFTLAQIIATSEVLNRNEVFRVEDVLIDDLNLFKKHLDILYIIIYGYI